MTSRNEVGTDKIRKYRVDYNKNPHNVISFMIGITSTSGRFNSEFVLLLFFQSHRETDRFYTSSGVQFHNLNVSRSTTGTRCSPHKSNLKSVTSSPRLQHYGLTSISTVPLLCQDHTLTHHTRKPLGN